ncbi:MAG: hypothetical protein LBR60_05120 [Fibrobacter sp.]|jgi:hypothetical protein|nr:hypothetical protein [Fibrobacter sp.]
MDELNTEASQEDPVLTAKKAAKMKILLVVNIVVIVGLLVIMFAMKSGYAEQAKVAVSTQTRTYTDGVQQVSFEQDRFVEEWSMLWDLVFQTLSATDPSEAAFKNNLSALETAYNADPQKQELWKKWGDEKFAFSVSSENGVYQVKCGADCSVSFTFVKGTLKNSDYSALASLDVSSKFVVDAPKPFKFAE